GFPLADAHSAIHNRPFHHFVTGGSSGDRQSLQDRNTGAQKNRHVLRKTRDRYLAKHIANHRQAQQQAINVYSSLVTLIIESYPSHDATYGEQQIIPTGDEPVADIDRDLGRSRYSIIYSAIESVYD